MPRLVRQASEKAGLPPGSLVYVGEQEMETVKITVLDYDEEGVRERPVERVEEAFPFREEPTVTWINVDGLHRSDILEKLGDHYGLHPLVLEDLMNTGQRSKLEDYDDYVFVVLRMLTVTSEGKLDDEQVSLILGPNYVMSFQEREGDVFDLVRERIRGGKGRIRRMGPDYLLYALVDVIVDHYFGILEVIGDRVEDLQEELVTDPTQDTLRRIHGLKRTLIELRRSVWPLRESVSRLQRGESDLVDKGTQVYLRDVYDHTVQVMDTVESQRDMVSGMLDIYLSSVSNRMNEVMKLLTVIATIFIPLTFIAGVYGMNFANMPELNVPWAYFVALGVMGVLGVIMGLYFWRKGWL